MCSRLAEMLEVVYIFPPPPPGFPLFFVFVKNQGSAYAWIVLQ